MGQRIHGVISDSHRSFRFFKVQTDCGAHPPSYSMDSGYFSLDKSGRKVNLATCLHIAPRLRMSGVIPLLPPGLHVVHRNKFVLVFCEDV